MLSLMCDHIECTVEDLREKGLEFARPIEDEGLGRLVRMKLPGAGEIASTRLRTPVRSRSELRG